MLMMVNPARKRRKARARKRTARDEFSQLRDERSYPRKRRKRRNATTTTRTTTVSTKKANPPRKRRRKRRSGSAPRARARRRNPPTGRGLVRRLQNGLANAAAAVVGKAASRAVPQLIGVPTTGLAGVAAQVAVGLGIGLLADRLPISSQLADSMLTGALMGPIESAVVGMNIPFLSPALSSYPLASYPLAGGLIPPARMNALPGSTNRPQEFQGYGYDGYYGGGYAY